jgi:hypothetical protein
MLEFKPVKKAGVNWLYWIMALIFLTMLIPAGILGRQIWAGSHLAYEVAPEAVIIHYGSGAIRIDRSAITQTQIVEPVTLRRTNGTGMPGLYLGRWTVDGLRVQMYATSLDRVLLLSTADGTTYALSPEDPAAFVDALKRGTAGQWQPLRAQSPWSLALTLGAFNLVVFAIIGGILGYYARLPRTIRYTLGADGLTIAGGRMHVTLPYERITSVQMDSPKGTPWRKFGAALPGLYWGNFSWRGIGGLKVYATVLKPLVLIVADGQTYAISPDEPERFAGELNGRL